MSYFDQLALTKIVQRRAANMNVTVKFQDEYRINNTRSVTLCAPKINATPDEQALLKLQYIEGPARVKRLENTIKLAGEDDTPLMSTLWTVLESDTAQKLNSVKYMGDRRNVSAGNVVVTEHIANAATELGNLIDPEKAKAVQDLLIAKTLLNTARAGWDDQAPTDTLIHNMNEDSLKKVKAISNSGIVKQLSEAESEAEVRSAAELLYKYIYEPPPEQEGDSDGDSDDDESKEGEDKEEDTPQGGVGEGEGEAGEGTGEGADVSGDRQDGQGESEGDAGSSQEPELTDKQKEAQKAAAKDLGLPLEPHGKQEPSQQVGQMPGSPSPAMEGQQQIVDMKTEQRLQEDDDFVRGSIAEVEEAGTLHARVVGNKIRRYLMDKKRTKIQTHRKHGTLHNRNLYRIASPIVGDGSWNGRVFKRKIEGIDINTCVTILVDMSGSMGGNKLICATRAAMALNEVFGRVVKVPVEVLSFAACGRGGNNGIIKAYNDTNNNEYEIADRMFRFYANYSGGNHDANAVLWATNRLVQRKEGRKLLIVLSDGRPTTYYGAGGHGNSDAMLKHVVSEVKRRADVEVYGIGIHSAAVKDYYGSNTEVVSNISELPEALLKTVKNGVLKC